MTTADTVTSTETIRTHFPALSRMEGDVPVAFFDGPGGTQVPRAVVDSLAEYLYRHNANTHWEYPTSAETDGLLQQARVVFADFLRAEPNEIVFGQNMTTLTFHLARALGWSLSAEDVVVVTELDHHANVAPWKTLARERGLQVRVVRMDPATGTLDAADLERALALRPRIVAVGAASNALGTITDVAPIVQRAHEAGALVFVDAVHYAPHELVDVRAMGCDFLACSPYKFYGPHLGVLYARRDLLEELEVPRLDPAPASGPEKMETGTLSHEAIVGAAAAVEFLASLSPDGSRRERLAASYKSLAARGHVLVEQMWDGLAAIPGVRLFGPPPQAPRASTVGFTLDGVASSEVARFLAQRGVYVSHGDFYAATVIERLELGPEGLVRAGCACYTTAEEVDRLVRGVQALAS